MPTTIPPMSDSMAAHVFTVVLDDRKVWPIKREARVIDPSAMDADELRRCQRVERADRVSRMADLAGDMKQLEADDVSITDLIPSPTYI